MVPHLVGFKRQTACSKRTGLIHLAPSCIPDITISQHGKDASKSKLWRDRDAFGEVKSLKKQGPKPAITGTIPAIVIQSADYARLFMSARPYMLFCVGVLVFRTEFCVGIFDRDGITFSPRLRHVPRH
jgi:hypothetical protein